MKNAAPPAIRRYPPRTALRILQRGAERWAHCISPPLWEDLRQEMSVAILASHPLSGRATLSFYRSAMYWRAIDFLRREARQTRGNSLQDPEALRDLLAKHPHLARFA